MSTTEVAPAEVTTARKSPLDDIVVKKPEASNEKMRRWLCGIKPIPGMEHLDRYVGVGPATFGKHSFVWEGAGKDARQIEIKGVINSLTDKQVEEIRDKLKCRYLRPVRNRGVVTGFADVDSSDGGGVIIDKETGEHKRRAPAEIPGRTVAGDIPLKDFLTMDVVYEDKSVRGRVVTLDEAKRIVAEAEQEINRPLESVDATFETGRDKRDELKADPKVDAALEAMAKSRPSIGESTPITTDSFSGGSTVGRGKNVTGGAGRLPEKK